MIRSTTLLLSTLIVLVMVLPLSNSADEDLDPRTLEKVWEFVKDDDEATFWKLDWSPDGTLIAATFFDNTCYVLNASDGSVLTVLDLNPTETRCDGFAPDGTMPLRACAFSPDGRYLAVGGDSLKVVVFNVGTWDRKWTLPGHEGSILCLDFSPNSRYLASGSGTDKVIPQNAGENITRVWDMNTGFPVTVLKGHRDGVLGVKWSHDGERIATCSDDRTVRIWSFPGSEVLLNISGHTSGVLDLDWSPDDSILITGSRDYKIKTWNTTTGEGRTSWGDHNCVRGVDIHPNGQIAAISGVDLTLDIKDMETGSDMKVFKDGVEQHAMVMHSRWSPDGRYLASGLGKTHTVILYRFGGEVEEDPGKGFIWIGTIIVMVILSAIFMALLYRPVINRIKGRRS